MAAFFQQANPHITKEGSRSPLRGAAPACCFAGRSK